MPYEQLGFKEKQKLLKEMDPMLDIKLVGKNKHRGTIILKKNTPLPVKFVATETETKFDKT